MSDIKEAMSLFKKDEGWVNIMDSNLRIREDGRVDCYSSAGYRILDLDSLPEETQIKVVGAALLKAHKKTIKLQEKSDALKRNIANLVKAHCSS